MRKLTAWVYKSALGDSSNNGISHNYDSVVCYWLDHGEKISDINDVENNAVVFISRALFDKYCPIFQPIKPVLPNHVGYMSGGCLISSSDSRFSEWCGLNAVPLHDRQETQAAYDMHFD